MKQSSRLEAFKRGEHPYGQTAPGVAEVQPQYRAGRGHSRGRFRAARARHAQERARLKEQGARERAQLVDQHRLIASEGAQLLVQVYGPPAGSEVVVDCVRRAKAYARARIRPASALSLALAETRAPLAEVVECLRAMRGAT